MRFSLRKALLPICCFACSEVNRSFSVELDMRGDVSRLRPSENALERCTALVEAVLGLRESPGVTKASAGARKHSADAASNAAMGSWVYILRSLCGLRSAVRGKWSR
eukprot:1237009-Rhodomonas_salina.2